MTLLTSCPESLACFSCRMLLTCLFLQALLRWTREAPRRHTPRSPGSSCHAPLQKGNLVSGNSLSLRLYIMYSVYNVECTQCTMYTVHNVYNTQCIQWTMYNLYNEPVLGLYVEGWILALRALQGVYSLSIPAVCTPKSHTCHKQGRTQGRNIALAVRQCCLTIIAQSVPSHMMVAWGLCM